MVDLDHYLLCGTCISSATAEVAVLLCADFLAVGTRICYFQSVGYGYS